MKMQQYLSTAMVVSVIALTACAPQKNAPEAKQSVSASSSREHCLAKGSDSACFVEVEKSGKSSFYAPASDFDGLVTNPLLTDLNISMKKVDDKAYLAMVNDLSASTIVYNEASPEEVQVYANTSAEDGYVNSKGRRIAGGIGGGFTGALGGAATGASIGTAIPGVGTVIGAIGGAIMGGIGGGFTGAATFWNGNTNVVYHFGDNSSTQVASVEMKKN